MTDPARFNVRELSDRREACALLESLLLAGWVSGGEDLRVQLSSPASLSPVDHSFAQHTTLWPDLPIRRLSWLDVVLHSLVCGRSVLVVHGEDSAATAWSDRLRAEAEGRSLLGGLRARRTSLSGPDLLLGARFVASGPVSQLAEGAFDVEGGGSAPDFELTITTEPADLTQAAARLSAAWEGGR